MKPKIYEDSKVPVVLSYLSPVSWINIIQGKPMFDIWAITLGPFVFVQGKASESLIRHETIHALQYMETWYIGFLLLYVWDWIRAVFKYGDADKAYFQIRAEQEAYEHEFDEDYLDKRIPREWIKKYRI